MREIKELLKFDYELNKEVYRVICILLVVGMLFMGVFNLNMGLLIIVISYTLEIDTNRNNYNLMINTLPINNKQYITYRYLSSFIKLITLVMVLIILSVLVLLAQEIIISGNRGGVLWWISDLIVSHNRIESNYIVRFILEIFIAIITVCILNMNEFVKYKSKKNKGLVFILLILINSFVGSCISKDYTWVLYNFIEKFNIVGISIFTILASILIIYYSYNKSIKLYEKYEIA